MDQLNLQDLLEKHRKGEASPEECALVEGWYLTQGNKTPSPANEIDYEAKKQELWDGIMEKRSAQLPMRRKLWPRIAAAASILLVLSVGGFLLVQKQNKAVSLSAVTQNDIAPGSNKAILTLSDGSRVVLNNGAHGKLATQGNTIISQNLNGQIAYHGTNNTTQAIAYNTVTTPKGGEYQIVLPDGTHVWLNAASSLKYPVAFVGKDRKVELTGEAYFEVARNKAKPFRVGSVGQTVEVLGTHFNIMAYDDEEGIKTTLLEGSVKVTKGTAFKYLEPGQQAIVSDALTVSVADTELAVAWKEGRTSFKSADIPTLMRSLSRWYNVDIDYRGTIPKRLFTGGIPRKSNLSTMLKILEEMNIHARIEGRKIIVTP